MPDSSLSSSSSSISSSSSSSTTSSSSSTTSSSSSSSSSSASTGTGWGRFWPACCNCQQVYCNATICAVTCGGLSIPGGAMIVVRSNGAVVASGFAYGGCLATTIPAGGAYEVIASAPGYGTYDAVIDLQCNTTVLVPLRTTPAVVFNVSGCCGNFLPGATVTIQGVEYTTDVDGDVTWYGTTPGTYPYTVTYPPLFQEYDGSVTLTSCSQATQNIHVPMKPAAGYACGPSTDGSGNPNPLPIPTILTLTSALYGAVTITYGGSTWIGSILASFAAACNCPSSDFTATYSLDFCFAEGSSPLFAEISVCDYSVCFAGTPSTIQFPCPCETPLSCTGQPNGTQLLTGGGSGAGWITSATIAITSVFPFDATVTVPVHACAGGSSIGVAWFPGDTITLTE